MAHNATSSINEQPALTPPGVHFFEHFPAESTCLLCGTNDDLPCILVGINGTAHENIERAQPIHLRCVADYRKWRIDANIGVMYARRHEP